MDDYSQFSIKNCSKVDLNKINLVFCGTGAVCCIISVAIVLLIIVSKTYYSILQRFFLYLMLAILLRELFIAASFGRQRSQHSQDMVCSVIGFLWNWTGILVFVFTVGMKVYLFFYVKRLTKGDTRPVFIQSKRGRVILESLYVVLSFIITLSYASLPFLTDDYGLAGAWCWIRAINVNEGNCTVSNSGMIHQLSNGYIFYVSGSVIGLVLLIAISVLYCRIPKMHSEARTLLKKTFFVIITFVANVVIMIFALLARVSAVVQQSYSHSIIWYFFGVTFPVSMLLFPIVYMICFFRVNQGLLCFRKLYCLIKGRDCSIQNPTTVPKSSRVSAPSVMYFEVPYTNAFTDVDVSEPLVINADAAGYKSLNTKV